MANKALALYTGSSSIFNLDEIPQAINLVSEKHLYKTASLNWGVKAQSAPQAAKERA
jgi:hypothetical protein